VTGGDRNGRITVEKKLEGAFCRWVDLLEKPPKKGFRCWEKEDSPRSPGKLQSSEERTLQKSLFGTKRILSRGQDRSHGRRGEEDRNYGDRKPACGAAKTARQPGTDDSS